MWRTFFPTKSIFCRLSKTSAFLPLRSPTASNDLKSCRPGEYIWRWLYDWLKTQPERSRTTFRCPLVLVTAISTKILSAGRRQFGSSATNSVTPSGDGISRRRRGRRRNANSCRRRSLCSNCAGFIYTYRRKMTQDIFVTM